MKSDVYVTNGLVTDWYARSVPALSTQAGATSCCMSQSEVVALQLMSASC